jgi:hypothetical protein
MEVVPEEESAVGTVPALWQFEWPQMCWRRALTTAGQAPESDGMPPRPLKLASLKIEVHMICAGWESLEAVETIGGVCLGCVA